MEVMKLFLNIAVVVSIFFVSSCSNVEKKNYEPLILKKDLAEKVYIKGSSGMLGLSINMLNNYRFNLNIEKELNINEIQVYGAQEIKFERKEVES